ncbi:hypothetical protein VNO77_12517 [Canavalia gladiata]|uniref:Uncharacterized protein n=1 Tax=Canavalia gladiata TaxID=3824 RepID=A0AAN9QUG0_CANGL
MEARTPKHELDLEITKALHRATQKQFLTSVKKGDDDLSLGIEESFALVLLLLARKESSEHEPKEKGVYMRGPFAWLHRHLHYFTHHASRRRKKHLNPTKIKYLFFSFANLPFVEYLLLMYLAQEGSDVIARRTESFSFWYV